MKKIIDLDARKCSACGACAVACMDQNDLDLSGGVSLFRVVCDLEEKDGGFQYYSIACFHCEDAPCILACPFGAPSYGADGKMIKCDGCAERVKYGLEPACVNNCANGVLRCIDAQEFKTVKVNESLRKIMGKG